jgi:Thioredoxin like C-terminal domain/AhpC/TSA family
MPAGLHTASAQLPVEGELPSLGGATGWLNSPPLTPADLRGKLVLVNFCTYTCINWLRQLPYVRAWAEKYTDRRLVVIGAHTPEFDFEHNVDNVRQAVRDMRIAYPVAIDNDYGVWRAFDNHYWPALYFVDAQAQIPPSADHGTDADDEGLGTVTDQRLYQLIRQRGPISDHRFEIAFLDPGVQAYAFTFG